MCNNELPTTYTDGKMYKYTHLQEQLDVLMQLAPIYGGRTLDNVIQDIQSQLKELEKKWKKN